MPFLDIPKTGENTAWVLKFFSYIITPSANILPSDFAKANKKLAVLDLFGRESFFSPKLGFSPAFSLTEKYPDPKPFIVAEFRKTFGEEEDYLGLEESVDNFETIKTFYQKNNCVKFINFSYRQKDFTVWVLYLEIFARQQPEIQVKVFFKEKNTGELFWQPVVIEKLVNGDFLILERKPTLNNKLEQFSDYQIIDSAQIDNEKIIEDQKLVPGQDLVDSEDNLNAEKILKAQKTVIKLWVLQPFKYRIAKYNNTLDSTIVNFLPPEITSTFNFSGIKFENALKTIIIGSIQKDITDQETSLFWQFLFKLYQKEKLELPLAYFKTAIEAFYNKEQDLRHDPILDFKKIDIRQNFTNPKNFSIIAQTSENKIRFFNFDLETSKSVVNFSENVKINTNLFSDLEINNITDLKITTISKPENPNQLFHNLIVLGENLTTQNDRGFLVSTTNKNGENGYTEEIPFGDRTSALFENNAAFFWIVFYENRFLTSSNERLKKNSVDLLKLDFITNFVEQLNNPFLSNFVFRAAKVRINAFLNAMLNGTSLVEFQGKVLSLDFDINPVFLKQILTKSHNSKKVLMYLQLENYQNTKTDFGYDRDLEDAQKKSFDLVLYINEQRVGVQKLKNFWKWDHTTSGGLYSIVFNFQLNWQLQTLQSLNPYLKNSCFSLSGTSFEEEKEKKTLWVLDQKVEDVTAAKRPIVLSFNKISVPLKTGSIGLGVWHLYFFEPKYVLKDNIFLPSNTITKLEIPIFGQQQEEELDLIPYYNPQIFEFGVILKTFDYFGIVYLNLVDKSYYWDKKNIEGVQFVAPYIVQQENNILKILVYKNQELKWLNLLAPNNLLGVNNSKNIFDIDPENAPFVDCFDFNFISAKNKEASSFISEKNVWKNKIVLQAQFDKMTLGSVTTKNQTDKYQLFDKNNNLFFDFDLKHYKTQRQIEQISLVVNVFAKQNGVHVKQEAEDLVGSFVDVRKLNNLKLVDYKFDIFKNGEKRQTVVKQVIPISINGNTLKYKLGCQLSFRDRDAIYEIKNVFVGDKNLDKWRPFLDLEGKRFQGETVYNLGGIYELKINDTNKVNIEKVLEEWESLDKKTRTAGVLS